MSLQNDLDSLIIDLKSDKPLKRNKAFGRLFNLLATQLKDVQDIVEENNNMLSWETIFRSAHQGNDNLTPMT